MLLLTKAVLVAAIGFLLATVLGLILLPILRKVKVNQKISDYMKMHSKKEGTPTMGGLIFILSTVIIIVSLIIFKKINYTSNLGIVLLVFLGYSIIGFLDDILSIKRKNNVGLNEYQKTILQVLIALGFFYIYMKSGGSTSLVVGIFGIDIDMGWLYGIFILLILVGASNSVNITDGLDGLAAGLSVIAMMAFSLISLVVGFDEIGFFSLILAGSLLGFLLFNTNPAKIFMGDTGSLAIGGVMGSIAILTHREITLLVVAGVFVLETLSVIIQITSVIFFKRKVFLMAPIHHHFEKLGWKETDIVKTFWTVGIIFAVAGILFGVWL